MKESAQNDPAALKMVTPRLIAVREALGLSKAEFSDALGIDRSSYTKMEKGAKPLLPKDAYRIWELYGIDMNFIYLGQIGGLPNHLSSRVMSNLKGLQE